VKKTKLAFICQNQLTSFIEPIVQQFEKFEDYQVRRYYIETQQDIIGAIKWADRVFIEWANDVAVFATQVYELKKKGVIIRLHSYESLTHMPQQIDWTMVDYLVFVAPHIQKIVEAKIPDLQDRVMPKVIYNGIDIDRIALNTDFNPHNIAYVCNINHKKEPALALQIMAELVKINPDYRLHVAGTFQDERYEIYMKYIAKEMGIEDNIIYYGFVNDMDEFWNGKGILLSTSIYEGHPFNIMEGAAHGLKPVIHNFMGAREMYPKCWLFNTVNEAIERIQYQPSDPKPYQYSRGYRQYIIDQGWTLENMVAQLKVLVDKLGGKK
jgi:glycosyltransferase involved in cell wall biosynthesis